MLFIDAAHQGRSWWQNFVDEDENSLLWAKLDALPNNIDKLSDGQVCRHQVFLLVDCGNIRFLNLFTDDLDLPRIMSAQNSMVLRQIDNHEDRFCVEAVNLPECGQRTSVECVRLLPCASRMGVRP